MSDHRVPVYVARPACLMCPGSAKRPATTRATWIQPLFSDRDPGEDYFCDEHATQINVDTVAAIERLWDDV